MKKNQRGAVTGRFSRRLFFIVSCGLSVAACSGIFGGNDGNDNRLAFLPSYSDVAKPIFETIPPDTSNIQAFVPLGNLNPSGHIFPTDHHYFYLTNPTTPEPVYAPGHAWITEVTAFEHVKAGFADYSMTIYSCKEVSARFGHISALDPAISSTVGSVSGAFVDEYLAGGETYRTYRKEVAIEVSNGQVIGTAGGSPGQLALDFGVHDTRVTHTFANSARFGDENSSYLHAVSCIPYFGGTNQSWLTSVAGFSVSGPHRTIAPTGGTVEQDVPGTAQGIWFKPGATTYPEDPHVALVHDNIDPTKPVFSIGTSLPDIGTGVYSYTIAGTGLENRDFSQITAHGNTYVFRNLQSASGEMLLVRMPDANTLRLEVQADTTEPWNMTGNYVEFVR